MHPEVVTVRVEVPRGSFIKRKPDGRIDFVAPLPCPYNYGSIEHTLAPDGDPFDALVVGPRIPYGARWVGPIQARFGFTDNGDADPKLICSHEPLTAAQRRSVELFFSAYAWLKRGLYVVRTRRGPTRAEGFE